MSRVIALGVNSVNMAHAPGQVAIRCINEQVIMIRHEAISTDKNIPQFAGFYEEINKLIVVFMFGKSNFAPTTPIHDVIPGARVFYAQWPAHADSLTNHFS